MLVLVGHLEEALVDAIIVEDLSMAAPLSDDLGLLWHLGAPFREWPIHPA